MSNEPQSTILLVDDDPSNLHFLVDQLFEQGFKLMVAKSGESALETAAILPPNIILLDVRMPNGIDGFETCRRLKADPRMRAIPVIFLSASSDDVDKEEGLRVGGVDYIIKPLNINEVLLRIRTHLSLRRLHLELTESNALLEERVAARTEQLTAEITRRTHSEAQQTLLLATVRSQSSQLQQLTIQLSEMQSRHRKVLGQELTVDIATNLAQVNQRMSRLHSRITNHAVRTELVTLTQQLQEMETTIRKVTDDLQKSHPEETRIMANPLLKLSDREREVLVLLANQNTLEEIASLLHISISTVRTYRHRMLQKLGVSGNEELLDIVLRYLV